MQTDNDRDIARSPSQVITCDNRSHSPPGHFLEIAVLNPETHGLGNKRFTDYEIRLRTNLPIFCFKNSSVRRRYSDFDWLKKEIERDTKMFVPSLPSKAWKRQIPSFLRGDDGIFEDEFIEERREGLEEFINKVAGHPLAQNERSLHVFLQEPTINLDKYVPGKVRTS